MEDKKLTPMMELELDVKKLIETKCYLSVTNFSNDILNLIEYYKEKERQMVIDAYIHGELNLTSMNPVIITAEEYYNETFKTK